MQLELFDYRYDRLFDFENQIAHYYDMLSETHDKISYSEHIDPKKKLLGENSDRLENIIVDFKNSLIIDIWVYLFNKVK